MAELPRGTVTFLFTDIDGSTRLIDEVGERRYEELLAEHMTTLRTARPARGSRRSGLRARPRDGRRLSLDEAVGYALGP